MGRRELLWGLHPLSFLDFHTLSLSLSRLLKSSPVLAAPLTRTPANPSAARGGHSAAAPSVLYVRFAVQHSPKLLAVQHHCPLPWLSSGTRSPQYPKNHLQYQCSPAFHNARKINVRQI